MSYQSITTLTELAFVSLLNNQSWVSNQSITVTDSFGEPLANWPVIQVMCRSTNEQPEMSGNFMATVELLIVGGIDSANADTYEQNVQKHQSNAGYLHNFITDTLSATSLENAVPSYSNALEVYDIRFVGCEREINASEGTFEDIFNLEVHLREA